MRSINSKECGMGKQEQFIFKYDFVNTDSVKFFNSYKKNPETLQINRSCWYDKSQAS